jgi:hypothetical protein
VYAQQVLDVKATEIHSNTCPLGAVSKFKTITVKITLMPGESIQIRVNAIKIIFELLVWEQL